MPARKTLLPKRRCPGCNKLWSPKTKITVACSHKCRQKLCRQQHKALGLCEICTNPQGLGDTRFCDAHREGNKVRARLNMRARNKKRWEKGLCKECLNPVELGYTRCAKHRRKNNAWKWAKRMKKLDNFIDWLEAEKRESTTHYAERMELPASTVRWQCRTGKLDAVKRNRLWWIRVPDVNTERHIPGLERKVS